MANVLKLFSLDVLEPIPKKKGLKVNKSRWGTLEFYFYYVVFAVCVPKMWLLAMHASREKDNPNWSLIEPLLSPGWILGRKMVRIE